MEKNIFKIGDFVRIKDSTHDDRMPPSRMGHIIQADQKSVRYWEGPVQSHVWSWRVLMTNGIELTFHEMFLEHVK